MYEIFGKLHVKGETQKITEKFQKREFVIKTTNQYDPFIKLELKQNGCEAIDDYSVGDDLKVGFYIGGREYTKNGVTNYFTSLTANTIDKVTDINEGSPKAEAPKVNEKAMPATNEFDLPEEENDLPF